MLDVLERGSSRHRPLNLPTLTAGNLELRVARTQEELEAAQRLRHSVFSEEMQAVFPEGSRGIDADEYDPFCEHLLVYEQDSAQVVGTYRLLTPVNAALLGRYYSESEFDLSPLHGMRTQLVELGRSCIRHDHRNGAVILLLWAGIAHIVRQLGLRYVLGCASVSLRDGGLAAAHVWQQACRDMQHGLKMPYLRPHHPYPVKQDVVHADKPVRMPPLIKGYMKVGARICGEPAWDPDFNTADFPVFLDIEHMDTRYRRHFGLG